MDVTFDEVVKLAEQLDPEHQNLLIYRLRVKQMQMQSPIATESARHASIAGSETISPTREDLIREAEILRQTPVRPDNSLLGKYANPNLSEMSEEAFHAQMHAIATEWEQELDDFSNDKS